MSWLVNSNKSKSPDQLFEDLEKKMEDALQKASQLKDPVHPSFWKYFQIKSPKPTNKQ